MTAITTACSPIEITTMIGTNNVAVTVTANMTVTISATETMIAPVS